MQLSFLMSLFLLPLTRFRDACVFLAPVDRPNLEFKVLPKTKRNVVKDIAEFIQSLPGQAAFRYCSLEAYINIYIYIYINVIDLSGERQVGHHLLPQQTEL